MKKRKQKPQAKVFPPQVRDKQFYEELMEFTVSLANKLQACGAETYRVEESINRIVNAYGVERVDAFVIPGSVMASLETEEGQIVTKIRRLKGGDTLLEAACRGRGWLLSGGRLDTERGSALVLDEFRAGKIGKITIQPADE